MEKLLIADDHTIVRKGLISMCKYSLNLSGIDEAEDCAAVMAALRRKSYTHLVIDIEFPDGTTLAILPNIRMLYPDLNIMVFTMKPFKIYQRALASLGILHFLAKDSKEEETVTRVKRFLSESKESQGEAGWHKDLARDFSPRQTEILFYLLKGMGVTKIGQLLAIHPSTVWTHKNQIFQRANVANIAELKDWADVNAPTVVAKASSKKGKVR
jgi:DNA-binding NarL/FixJ family response regulator